MPLCRWQGQWAALSQQQVLRHRQLAGTLQHLPCIRQVEPRRWKHAAQLLVGWLQPGWDLPARMRFLLEVSSFTSMNVGTGLQRSS